MNRGPIPKQILDRLPENHLLLYAHLWELETWLREMVYVELMARYGQEWSTKIAVEAKRVRRMQASDERLRHMPTREKLSTSYIQFSDLCRTISRRWVLFNEYLPPKDIWSAKLREVIQIRNRIAHFRDGHEHDIDRLRQFLRDVDQGLWKFCTSYNDRHPLVGPREKDPVAREFAALDPFPWTETEPGNYSRLGSAPPDLILAVSIEYLRRPWLKSKPRASIIGRYGYLYDVTIVARGQRVFDYDGFLSSTAHLHNHVCHICLDNSQGSLRLTVPAVGGASVVLPVLREFVKAARNSMRPGGAVRLPSLEGDPMLGLRAMDKYARKWPEHVLGPGNPLTFLGPGEECPFFGMQ